MLTINKNIDSFRSLSQIFTTSSFNKVIRDNDSRVTERKLRKYVEKDSTEVTFRDLLSEVYTTLEKDYRSEYFYKNRLIISLLEKYSLNTTTILNELKIGASIADLTLLNGKVKIFEIKTDLDGFDKLSKQIQDYRQFADLVYIVTSAKNISRILSDYNETTIGIIEFGDDNEFIVHKEAQSNVMWFNHVTIFKMLRKAEYLQIIKNYFGIVPDVPNTELFRSCLELITKIDKHDFQKMAFGVMKKRKLNCPELWKSKKTPFELKHICYSLNFTEREYIQLYKFLNKPL